VRRLILGAALRHEIGELVPLPHPMPTTGAYPESEREGIDRGHSQPGTSVNLEGLLLTKRTLRETSRHASCHAESGRAALMWQEPCPFGGCRQVRDRWLNYSAHGGSSPIATFEEFPNRKSPFQSMVDGKLAVILDRSSAEFLDSPTAWSKRAR
jgi:hypothetical protein